VLRLNREIQAVLGDPDIRRRFADGGLDITSGTPEEFGAILKRDYAKYGKILTSAGIKPE
jgi:tripartite-type tricarboxylate transporter receptor subunit TctC